MTPALDLWIQRLSLALLALVAVALLALGVAYYAPHPEGLKAQAPSLSSEVYP